MSQSIISEVVQTKNYIYTLTGHFSKVGIKTMFVADGQARKKMYVPGLEKDIAMGQPVKIGVLELSDQYTIGKFEIL